MKSYFPYVGSIVIWIFISIFIFGIFRFSFFDTYVGDFLWMKWVILFFYVFFSFSLIMHRKVEKYKKTSPYVVWSKIATLFVLTIYFFIGSHGSLEHIKDERVEAEEKRKAVIQELQKDIERQFSFDNLNVSSIDLVYQKLEEDETMFVFSVEVENGEYFIQTDGENFDFYKKM